MSKLGYTGYTAQLVKTRDGVINLLFWSPEPQVESISKYDRVCDEMVEQMTENLDDWRMWYEQQRDENQIRA